MKISDHLYLFTVTDRFLIKEMGIVVVPGIPRNLNEPMIRKGAPLILRSPLGDITETYLKEVDMISLRTGSKPADSAAVLLPGHSKSEIPIGTDVYLKQT